MTESTGGKPSERSQGTPAKDETGLLDVLRLLMESGKARTTADLLKYATQYGAPESVERLKMLEVEGIPLDLAFDFVSVHLRVLKHKRNSALVGSARGKRVGVVVPMAPHVIDLFLPVADVTLLQPEPGPLHGPTHELENRVVKGARECRAKVQDIDVLVFEAFRDAAGLHVEAAVADALEPKLLPQGIALIAHLRPHGKPGDLRFVSPSAVAFI
jgi:hypothetical protein